MDGEFSSSDIDIQSSYEQRETHIMYALTLLLQTGAKTTRFLHLNLDTWPQNRQNLTNIDVQVKTGDRWMMGRSLSPAQCQEVTIPLFSQADLD